MAERRSTSTLHARRRGDSAVEAQDRQSIDRLKALPADRDEEIFAASFDGRILRRFFGFMRPYKITVVVGVLAVLVFTLTQLAIPLIIRETIDGALVDTVRANELLAYAVIAFFAMVFINYLSNYFQLVLVARMGERVLVDIRRAMYAHLQRVSLSFMDKTEVGRLMSRLQGDVNSIQEFLETSIMAIGDFLLILGIVIVLLSLDPWLGLLTLSVVPALVLVRIIWLPIAKRAFMLARRMSSIVNGALAENVNGVRTVQGMLRQGVNFDVFEGKARDNLMAHLRATRLAQIMVPTVDTLTGLAMAIVVVVGGQMVLGDRLEIGVMVAFLFYVQRFFDPIRSLMMQYNMMQRAMASGQRILEVLDVPIDVQDKPDAVDPDEVDGSVAFENVTFGYAEDQPVLKDVSFEIAPGETVALVGPTGSGKTSTIALLHRFYDVWRGAVRVGGYDVRDMTQESLGRHIAMVLQEPFLFTGTVVENIRFNRTGATLEQVVEAAKAVGAHRFITELPEGYDTILGQRGANLSIGQRQLLSFARALVADAKILVLDEATANIDSFTERDIQTALKTLLKGRTGIVIAHRLATIRNADRIMVLQEGRIVETGTHEELLAAKGLYQRLYSMNYASFDDVPDEVIMQSVAASAT